MDSQKSKHSETSVQQMESIISSQFLIVPNPKQTLQKIKKREKHSTNARRLFGTYQTTLRDKLNGQTPVELFLDRKLQTSLDLLHLPLITLV